MYILQHHHVCLTFLSENEAVCPPRTSSTGMRLRWMLLMTMGRNWPRASGPSSRVSLSRISPLRVVPDTTVPTPCCSKRAYCLYGRTDSVRYDFCEILNHEAIKKSIACLLHKPVECSNILLLGWISTQKYVKYHI